MTSTDTPIKLIVIDQRVDNADALVAAAGADARVVLIDGSHDGIAQITAALAAMPGAVDSLQILSHGSDGALLLGNGLVTQASLAATADWSPYLTADADILLAGCDLASGAAGRSFVDTLANVTGADVAASNDLTGAANQGGDWDLEVSHGTIETGFDISAAALAGWDGLLTIDVNIAVGGTSTLTYAQVLAGAGGTAGVGFTPTRFDVNNTVTSGTLYKVSNFTDYAWGTPGQFDTADFTNRIYSSMDLKYVNNGGGNGTTVSVAINFSDGFSNKSDTIVYHIGGGGGVNHAPVANTDSFTVTENVLPLTISSFALLANDTDQDPGTQLAVLPFNITTAKGSTVIYDPQFGGAITYITGPGLEYLDTGETGSDSFTYTLSDGLLTATGTVNLTVNGVNDAPYVSTGITNKTAVANTTSGFSVAAGTFVDPEARAMTLTAGLAAGGALPSWITYNAGTNSFSFTPATGNLNSTVSVRLTATDHRGLTAFEDFDVTVTAGTAPTGVADNQTSPAIAIGGNKVISQATLIANDTDPDTGHAAGLVVTGASTASSNISVAFDSNTHAVTVSGLNTATTQALAAGETRNETLTYAIVDPNGLTGSGTVTVAVVGVNDAPVGSGLTQSLSYTEDQAKALTGLSVSDVDNAETVTATLTLSSAAAGALSGGSGSYDAQTGVYTVSGTVSAVNSALSALQFTPTANASGNLTIAVSIADGGENGAVAATGTLTLTGVPANDAPTANGAINQALTVIEDTATPLTAIVVTDPDANDVLTATLTVANPSAGSLSGSAGGSYDSNTGIFTVTGSLSQVNAALAALSFTPAADSNLGTSIAVTISDAALASTSGTIAVSITPVNDSPLFDVAPLASVTLTEDQSAASLAPIAINDVDLNEQITATASLSDASAATLDSTSGSFDANTGVFTISGTVATVNAALAALTITPAADRDTGFSVNYQIVDGLEDGASAATATTTVIMTAVNDQPIATALTQTLSFVEDAASVVPASTMSVSDPDTGESLTLSIVLADSAAGQFSGTGLIDQGGGSYDLTGNVAAINTALASLQFNPAADHDQSTTASVSISDGGENGTVAATGTLSLNVTPVNDAPLATNTTQTVNFNEDAGATGLTAIVVTDPDTGEIITATLTLADASSGVFTSTAGSFDANSGVYSVSGSVAAVNDALAQLAYQPAADWDQDTTASLVISDGGEDGATAATGTITLDVNPINDSPIGQNLTQTITVTEDGAAGTAPLALSVNDVDTNESLTLTLTMANPAAGVLAGTGLIDQGGGVYGLTGTLAAVNGALSALSFTPGSNVDVGTTVAVVIADGGEDGATTATGTLTLDITAVNDAPTASNTNQTLAFTEDASTIDLTDIVVSDPDTGEVLMVTLTLSDSAAGAFSGSGSFNAGTGTWTVIGSVASINAALSQLAFTPAENYEFDASVAVTIRDGGEDGANAVTDTIQLDVTPVNDAPSLVIGTNSHSYADGANAIALADITVGDVDFAEELTVTASLSSLTLGDLSSSAGSFDSNTGVWSFTGSVVDANQALADLVFNSDETNASDGQIDIVVSDGGEDGAATATGSITLDVVPTPPVLIASNPSDDFIGLPSASPLVLTFGDIVTAGLGQVHLMKSADNSLVESFTPGTANAVISGQTLTLDPTNNFPSATGYYLLLDADVVRDPAGLGNAAITDPTALNFQSIFFPPAAPGGGTGGGGSGGPGEIINGDGGDNDLIGSAGDDVITANSGNDQVTAGDGNDIVYGNAGNDACYGNVGNDTLYGGKNNDDLYGGQGDDFLFGGTGVDHLMGGKGDDVLYGGTSGDIFLYQLGGDFGHDVIADFSFATGDQIDLSGQSFLSHTAITGGWRLDFADGSIIDIKTSEAFSTSWFL